MVTLPRATEPVNRGFDASTALQTPGHVVASSAGADGAPPDAVEATFVFNPDRIPPVAELAPPRTGCAVSRTEPELGTPPEALRADPEATEAFVPPVVARGVLEVAAPPKTKERSLLPPMPRLSNDPDPPPLPVTTASTP
ncbi:MAG TPA: hypothetical protein VKP30_03470 [Polyangiaceae bacterium]|nr:hypothetical protein [Polyangiaceae bacterium]